MFAGAAREAVFSNPEVIRRVNAEFVPVALKAGFVNNPPSDEEGRLCREIARSKPAPQGICIVNSAGKVLDWALMFDDDKSVLAFLDHGLKRFDRFPDAKRPFAAERYMKFPSQKLSDVEDSGNMVAVSERHPEGKHCPGSPRVERGTVLARVFGRALDKDGKPMADTVRQEHYVEDRFHVSVAAQKALARSLADAGSRRFRLPEDLSRLLVSHAFLGQLDVNPLGGAGGRGHLKQGAFWAQKIDRSSDGRVRLRIDGKSEAAGASSEGEGNDGRLWQHQVTLTWQGVFEMKDGQVTRLLLIARGSEKLKWGNKDEEMFAHADVTRLPAGHAINLRCGVRYGIIGEPVPPEETAGGEELALALPIPDEARRPLIQALGGAFIIFREKVQDELKLTDQQRQKLLASLPEHLRETMATFDKIKDLQPSEREKQMHEHRRKSEEKLSTLLRQITNAKQRERLFQLQLQQAGAFALLGQHESFKKLQITAEQRDKFMQVVHEMHKEMESLFREAQNGGNPQELPRRMARLRRHHEIRLEALMTDAQRSGWRQLLGKPFDLDD